MPKRSSRPRNLFGRFRNFTGLLIALAFALIGAGVVLLVFISQRPAGGANGAGNRASANVAKFGDLPDNIGEAKDITAVGQTKDARFQVADKNDPSRVAIELLFSQMNPVGNAVYEATDPRAWIYMKDGRTVYVRADQARVKRVGAAAPESGEFRGNGVALVFPPRVDEAAGRAIDPEQDVPGMVATFNAASFDTVLLELSSQEAFTVETDAVRLKGVGFVVRANQVQERLEFAKINSGGEIRYRVKDSAKQKPEDAAPAATDVPTVVVAQELVGPPAPAGWVSADAAVEVVDAEKDWDDAEPQPAPVEIVGPLAPEGWGLPAVAVKEDLYLAEFRDGVTVVQTTRTLTSDLLSVWLRFVDNKLPEGALGDVGGGGAAPRRAMATPPAMPVVAHVAAMALGQGTASAPAPASPSARSMRPRTLFVPSQADVILTWTGGMVAKPLSNENPPQELAQGNHVHARFTADRPGEPSRVLVTDREIGAAGVCAALDYAATTRQLSLAGGVGGTTGSDGELVPGVDRVDLTIPEAGRLIVPRLTFNLANGRGRAVGEGVLVQLPGPDPDLVTVTPEFPPLADPDETLPADVGRRISWSAMAEFKFRARQGQMSDALEAASFDGDVVARDRGSWLSGQQLWANFRETPWKKSALARLRVAGEALAYSRSTRTLGDEFVGPMQDAFVQAEWLDVRFGPGQVDRSDDEPRLAIARGGALVRDGRGSIEAERLEAALIGKSRGEGRSSVIEPGEVNASGGVIATIVEAGGAESGGGSDGPIVARASRLRADAQQRWVELINDEVSQVSLARGASIISGPQMRLDETLGKLEVFGAGSLRHVQLESTASEAGLELPESVLTSDDDSMLPPGVSMVRATWSRSMSYADAAGRIECHGDAMVSSISQEGGQVSRSERLLLDITPAADARRAQSAAAVGTGTGGTPGVVTLGSLGGGQQLDGRKLLRAESLGAVTEREAGAPASVKSWKFAARPAGVEEVLPPAPREYEQVLYLEGPRIVVDEVAGTMTVPEAGRGVTFDRSSRDAEGAGGGAAPATALSSGSSGRSQFTWGGELEFNRLTGALRMQRAVELRHLPLDSSELIRMVCDRLDATFNTRGGRGAELLTADAVGGVFAESGSRHLTADQFTFDAATGAATARSNSENPVTMHDTKTASPMLAKALKWDTRTDRIEVTEPMPVTGGMSR